MVLTSPDGRSFNENKSSNVKHRNSVSGQPVIVGCGRMVYYEQTNIFFFFFVFFFGRKSTVAMAVAIVSMIFINDL